MPSSWRKNCLRAATRSLGNQGCLDCLLIHEIVKYVRCGVGSLCRAGFEACVFILGLCRAGWSEWAPGRKLLPELLLPIGIVCALINKSVFGVAGWHASTMEIILGREKMCLCGKHFWIKLLSLCNSWYGQSCARVSCLPARQVASTGCCHALLRVTSLIPWALIAHVPRVAGPSWAHHSISCCFTCCSICFYSFKNWKTLAVSSSECAQSDWWNSCSNTARNMVVSGLSIDLQGMCCAKCFLLWTGWSVFSWYSGVFLMPENIKVVA